VVTLDDFENNPDWEDPMVFSPFDFDEF